MHLWPSAKLRDTFKIDYLKELEWNLHRMKTHKKNTQSQSDSKLLDAAEETPNSKDSTSCFESTLFIFRELFLIVSCCYCCFCCGACDEDEDEEN